MPILNQYPYVRRHLSFAISFAILLGPLFQSNANATATPDKKLPNAVKAGFKPKRAFPIGDLLKRIALDDILADIENAEAELLRLPTLPKVDDTALVNVDGMQNLLSRHKRRAIELKTLPNTPETRREIEQMTLIVRASRLQIKLLHSRFRAGDMLDSRSSLCGTDDAAKIPCGPTK